MGEGELGEEIPVSRWCKATGKEVADEWARRRVSECEYVPSGFV